MKDNKIEPILNKNNPKILIFSCFGTEHLKYLQYPCKKIYFTAERHLDNKYADYVVGFLPSNKPRYIQIRNYERCEYQMLNNYQIYKVLNGGPYPLKDKFCCFIVSNPGCWQRNFMFDELNKYKKVDSLGRYKNNMGYLAPKGEEFLKCIGKYKFNICFDNTSLKYYMTEKIYNCYNSRTVPIYWGDPEVLNVFNPESLIYIKTDENMEKQIELLKEAVKKIIELDQNDIEYRKMLEAPSVIEPEKLEETFQKSVEYLGEIIKN